MKVTVVSTDNNTRTAVCHPFVLTFLRGDGNRNAGRLDIGSGSLLSAEVTCAVGYEAMLLITNALNQVVLNGGLEIPEQVRGDEFSDKLYTLLRTHLYLISGGARHGFPLSINIIPPIGAFVSALLLRHSVLWMQGTCSRGRSIGKFSSYLSTAFTVLVIRSSLYARGMH